MHIEQKRFAVLDEPIGVPKIRVTLPNGLYFGPTKGHAALKPVEKEVIMAGHPVLGRIPLARGHRVARARRLLRGRSVFGHNHVAGLANHFRTSSDLHPTVFFLFKIGPTRRAIFSAIGGECLLK